MEENVAVRQFCLYYLHISLKSSISWQFIALIGLPKPDRSVWLLAGV
jgi:hypothetical protein